MIQAKEIKDGIFLLSQLSYLGEYSKANILELKFFQNFSQDEFVEFQRLFREELSGNNFTNIEVVMEVDKNKGIVENILFGSLDIKRLFMTILKNSQVLKDLRMSWQTYLKDEENMKFVLEELGMKNPTVNIDYRNNFL